MRQAQHIVLYDYFESRLSSPALLFLGNGCARNLESIPMPSFPSQADPLIEFSLVPRGNGEAVTLRRMGDTSRKHKGTEARTKLAHFPKASVWLKHCLAEIISKALPAY